jgi:hypothetical protein
MRNGRGDGYRAFTAWLKLLIIAAVAVMTARPVLAADAPPLEELVAAVVRIKTHINPEGQTVQGLGRDRDGSGILIDNDGLVLTIGYLMVEAYAAELITNDGRTVPATVVGYDNESGFGLLRATEPLKLKPIPLGKSADVKERDVVVIASFGGADMVAPAYLVAKREFAGNWEYMLDEALFTSPPHPAWSGAALISREGKLIGVGSLIVGDATGSTEKTPGNMFVPIDRLAPIQVGRGSASTPTSCAAGCLSAASRRAGRRRRLACGAAMSLSVWMAISPRPSPISIARSGRAVAPVPMFRSTCCRTTRCAGSPSGRSIGSIR